MNITGRLTAWAEKKPDGPAITTPRLSVSYGELDRAVSRTAARFAAAGLKPGDTVATLAIDQVAQLVASFALARLGATQIGIAQSDPPGRQRELAKKAKVAAAIAESSVELAFAVTRIDPPRVDPAEFKRTDVSTFTPSDDGALPFLLLATSGTTRGMAKIGILSQRRAAARFENFVISGPECRFLSPISMTFAGAVQNAYRCLLSGGCLILHDHLDTTDLPSLFSECRVNYVYATPSQASFLLGRFGADSPAFPGVRAFQLGTAFTPAPLRKLIRERLSPNLYIHYGTTEVGIIAIATPDHVARIPGAVGAPVPGVKVEIVDAEGHPVPAGEIGEIRVRSAAAIDFYLDDEDENARAFQNGWFRPRDSVSLTEAGVLIHHGRADDVIILDGINIYPFEIEDALLEHEAVTEAVAFSVKSPARGDIPLAAVVVKRSLVRAELLNYCHSLLGEHAPHDVIALASLPRNAMGKVVKTELPDIYRHAVAARKGTS